MASDDSKQTPPPPPKKTVEQFFRSVEQPSTPKSLFTAQDVAAIVRRDRDAAN